MLVGTAWRVLCSHVQVDVPTMLCCTLRSVSGKGDAEEQARKIAEELMTNVAKNFTTGSVGAQ